MDYPRQKADWVSRCRRYLRGALPTLGVALGIAVIGYFFLALIAAALSTMKMPEVGNEHKGLICIIIFAASIVGCELYELLLRSKSNR